LFFDAPLVVYCAFQPTEDFPLPTDENRRLNREAPTSSFRKIEKQSASADMFFIYPESLAYWRRCVPHLVTPAVF